MRLKKPIKIFLGVIIFLILPSMLFCGFLYFKYNMPLIHGEQGMEADNIATKMLLALNYEAYRNTDYIEWTFKNKRHYKWEKAIGSCDVYWKDYRIKLDLNDHSKSRAFVHGFTIDGDMGKELVEKGRLHFKNDVFWLVAPFRVFDEGVVRELVTLDGNEKGLLVTYRDRGTYLWEFDTSGKPERFKMWDSQTPINGLEASWSDWKTVESGAKLPTFHKILFFGFEISDIKTNAPKQPDT